MTARWMILLLMVGGCGAVGGAQPSKDFLSSCLAFSAESGGEGEYLARDIVEAIDHGEGAATWEKGGGSRYVLRHEKADELTGERLKIDLELTGYAPSAVAKDPTNDDSCSSGMVVVNRLSYNGRVLPTDLMRKTVVEWIENGGARGVHAERASEPRSNKVISSTVVTKEAGAAGSAEDLYSDAYRQCFATGQASEGVTVAMLDCIAAEHEVQDDLLNATYKRVIAGLGPAEQDRLRQRQRAWIKRRDSDCTIQDGGTLGQVETAECLLAETARRAAELKALGR